MKATGGFGAVPAVAVVVAALGLVVAGVGTARGAPVRLEVESFIPADSVTGKAMEIFSAEASRLSQGSVEITITRNSQRSVRQLIDDVHVGRLFATWSSAGMFSKMVPEILAVSLPFVFENYDQARHAVSGPVGTLISTKLEAKGFVVLAFIDEGTLQVTNARRPLKALADFQGLKVRVLGIATHGAAFKAIGAHPVTLEISDLADTLNQGDVDGLELPYSVIDAKRYYEHQKYLSDTGHFREFDLLVANRERFAALDPIQQKAVREAARIASVRQHLMAAEVETAALARLKGHGLQFDPLPADTRLALRRATAGVVDGVRNAIGARVVNEALRAGQRTAADRPAGTAPRP